MAIWSAFVDESGPLFELDRSAALVAWVLQGYPSRVQSEALRRLLHEALPGLVYPMHATRMRIVGHRVEAALRHAPLASTAAIEAARRVLESPDPQARLLADHTADGREAPWHVLQAADLWLWNRFPGLHRLLDDERIQADARMDRLFEQLCRGGMAFVVAAYDAPAPGEVSVAARYERVLSGLLERTGQILGGPRDVHVMVRTAHFHPDVAPSNAAQRARAFPLPGQPVGFTVSRPEVYRRAVHPGLVLADLAANRLGREVLPASTWDGARRAARVLPVERVPAFRGARGPLPTLAAEGAPREHVTAAFLRSGAPPPPLTDVRPGWAAEQALAWAAAVGAR